VETMRYERLFGHSMVRTIDNRLSRLLDSGSSGSSAPAVAPLDTFHAYCVLPLAGSTPRHTAAHLDNVYSYVIDIAAEPRPSGRSIVDEALGFMIRSPTRRRFLFDDPIGRALAFGFLPALDTCPDKHWAHVATLRGTELALALRLYQQTHDGKLPARLDELVPDYLPAVSVDPFSSEGEGFLYRVDAGGKWIVYSRGPNLRDNDGVWNYLDKKMRSQHRDSLDVIFAASEPERRRDNWRLEHPGGK